MMKTDIRRKSSRIVVVAVSIMGLSLLSVSFFGVLKLRLDTVGERQKLDAEIFSMVIAQEMEREVRNVEAYTNSPWWRDSVKEANLRYANWKPQAIKAYMANMDEQWTPTAAHAPFIQEWLNSRMSRRLEMLAKYDSAIAEIFLTDQYGGLVAASEKTSDFYQADELWWQRAFHKGKGDIFWGEIEVDASSGSVSTALAIPFRDETGKVIGVSKIALDMAIFFKPWVGYKIGKTGYLELLDEREKVIFHPKLRPMSKSELPNSALSRVLKNKKGYAIISGTHPTQKFIISAAKVRSPTLEANGIYWTVVVSQSQKEVLKPLYRIFGMGALLILAISFLISRTIQKILRDIFVSPLQKILDGTRRFSNGDLDYRITVKTGDELEQLAESLNEMSAHLKQTMVSRDNLTGEIERHNKTEKELRESEKRFFDVFNSSKDALLLVRGSKFVHANEAAAQMLGYATLEEFLKKHPSELSPPTQPDGRDSFEKADEMMRLAGEKGFHQFEWMHRKANGVDFPVQVSLTPITLQGERVLHCVWIDLAPKKQEEKQLLEFQHRLKNQAGQLEASLEESRKSREILSSMLEDNSEVREKLERNMTELKEAHALLVHAEKMEAVGRMASGVAHEVKNPLGIILMGINHFEAVLPPEEKENRGMLQMMKDSVKRADKIVRSLLDFARDQELTLGPQDINTIIESSLELVKHRLKLTSVELECALGKDLPKVSVERGKIEQVFINLFNNAVDAMPAGGKLYVRSYVPDLTAPENKAENGGNAFLRFGKKVVAVEIEDTGTGIDETILHKIFDPFFTTKNRTQGTGLGLSIVKSIIEMHEGLIDIESKKGKGSKFTLAFKIP